MNTKQHQVVIVPRPITLEALAAFLLFRLKRVIQPSASIRFSSSRHVSAVIRSHDDRVINLLAATHPEDIITESRSLDRHLGAWVRFILSRPTRVHETIRLNFSQAADQVQLHRLFTDVVGWIEKNLEGFNPWQPWPEAKFVELALCLDVAGCQLLHVPPDCRFLSVPFTLSDPSKPLFAEGVKGIKTWKLREGAIRSLCGRNIKIGVCGPSNSSKSGIAASLVWAIDAIINGLKSRPSWRDLELSVDTCDLDRGTQTLDAVMSCSSDLKRFIRPAKRPWTIHLVEEALGILKVQSADGVITVCDLPGKISPFSTELIAHLDACIFVSNEERFDAVRNDWLSVFAEYGNTHVSSIRSRNNTVGAASMASSFKAGHRFSGEIVRIDRIPTAWDTFIEQLAIFLLCDILPTQFGSRYTVEA